jgi:hypothetical protein
VAIIQIDFEGAGGSDREWPTFEPGKYPAKIEKIEQKMSKAGNPMLEWTYSVEGLPGTMRDWTSLQPNALWKLKSILKNLGFEVPDGPLDIDTDELIGMECAVELTLEPHWNGDKKEDGTPVMVNNIKDGGIYSRAVLESADSWS